MRCAAEYVRRKGADWESIEREMLNGQKLQGHLTCGEVYSILKYYRLLDVFPLFKVTHDIAFNNAEGSSLLSVLSVRF